MSELVPGMINEVKLVVAGDRLMVHRRAQPETALENMFNRVRREYFQEGFRGTFALRPVWEQLAFSSQLREVGVPTPRAYMAGMDAQLIDYIPNTDKLADLWLRKDERALPATGKIIRDLVKAHEAGLIPGDRSGKNELVTPNGETHLIDFDLKLEGAERTEFDMANFMYLVSRKVNNGMPGQMGALGELYQSSLTTVEARRVYNPMVMLRYMKTFADLSTPEGVARLSTMTPITDPTPSREMFTFLGEVLNYEHQRTA